MNSVEYNNESFTVRDRDGDVIASAYISGMAQVVFHVKQDWLDADVATFIGAHLQLLGEELGSR